MTETIFVVDGHERGVLDDGPSLARIRERSSKLDQVKAYLYSGWRFVGWGTAPRSARLLRGMTGFYFEREADQPDGFGAEQLLDRLRSGLHFGIEVHEEANA